MISAFPTSDVRRIMQIQDELQWQMQISISVPEHLLEFDKNCTLKGRTHVAYYKELTATNSIVNSPIFCFTHATYIHQNFHHLQRTV